MVKLKKYIKTGVLTAGLSALTLAGKTGSDFLKLKESAKDKTEASVTHAGSLQKREPLKVYHRFEEIPEISDEEAILYDRSDYTYIIDADAYRQSGEINLKRVLTAEITTVGPLSLVYRSECATYHPKENEDQLKCYIDTDHKLLSDEGTYVGPSQMNKIGVENLIKYMAAKPETREYVTPLLKQDEQTQTAIENYAAEIYNEDGTLRPMEDRNKSIHGTAFKNIRINETAWCEIASAELKAFIAKQEKRRGKQLNNMIKNYLCLTELMPDTLLKKTHEEFNLSVLPIGRSGKPKQATMALASALKLTDKEGNPDATRLPLYAIAAPVSHINWKGNGLGVLKEIPPLRAIFNAHPEQTEKTLIKKVKEWVCGKGKTAGVNELTKLNYITEPQIAQYCDMELAGAENLRERYNQRVEDAEDRITPFFQKDLMQQASKEFKISFPITLSSGSKSR